MTDVDSCMTTGQLIEQLEALDPTGQKLALVMDHTSERICAVKSVEPGALDDTILMVVGTGR